MSRGFSHAIVGVADLDEAARLWVDTFGLSATARRDGADEALESLWGLAPGSVSRQALVGLPGEVTGRLHLVEFTDPAPAVRSGARSFDLCPKNLDVRLTGMQERYDELVSAGWVMGSTPVRMPVDTMEIYEVQLKGPDVTNLSLVEVVGDDLPYTPQGYVAVTQVVGTNPDNPAAGLLRAGLLRGGVRVGAPRLSPVRGSRGGADGRASGRRQARHAHSGRPLQPVGPDRAGPVCGSGRNRPLPAGPATGLLGVGFDTDDLDSLVARAGSGGHPVEDLGTADTITGGGPSAGVTSPAGWRIEVREASG